MVKVELQAAYRFKEAAKNTNRTIVLPSSSNGEFSIGQEQLSSISREHDTNALKEYGGMFIWDACKDLTLIVLMVAAVASLALGIKSEGVKEGWYHGRSIAFAVILVISVTAVTDYKRSLQFEDLNEYKRNIHLQVIRDGRRVEISVYDVVVGDVIPLNIGNQTGLLNEKMMADKALVSVVEECVGGKKIIPPKTISRSYLLSSILCWLKVLHRTLMEVFLYLRMAMVLRFLDHQQKRQFYIGDFRSGFKLQFFLRFVELSAATNNHDYHIESQLGMDFEAVRSESSIIHVFPFNSDKKRGGVALQTLTPSLQPDAEIHIHWKGAAEIILACCTRYFDTNDQLVDMDEEKMTVLRNVIEDMAADSLRCVAVAYRLLDGTDNITTGEEELACWSLPENNLVLLAIVGLKDPCRPGVKDAVHLCQKAGVKVKMVTGDNVKTAKAIAVECGILDSLADATEPSIIEGKTEKHSEPCQTKRDKKLLKRYRYNRTTITALADIGLAMGIQGTEVAKESSDIIILDDNFASVVKVVKWGRSVYANIQKFIQFQLTINIAGLVINVIASFSTGDVPLNTVQLLWVNLIMDTPGALALATESPTGHLMDQLW
ncbi:hypothetical protein RYX36_027644 [Vicia faba]